MRGGTAIVLARELRRSGHRWQTHGQRALIAASGLLFVSILWYQRAEIDGTDRQMLSGIGAGIFYALAATQAFVLLGLAPILAAQTIQEERDNRTLEILATTRLTGLQILLGKVGARALGLVSLVLCGAPLLAMILSFGGVDPLVVLSSYVHLAGNLLVFAAIGAFVGMHAEGPVAPLATTLGWVFFLSPILSLVGYAWGGSTMVGWVLSLAALEHPSLLTILLPLGANFAVALTALRLGEGALEVAARGLAGEWGASNDPDSRSSGLDRNLTVVLWFIPIFTAMLLIAWVWRGVLGTPPPGWVAWPATVAVQCWGIAAWLLLSRWLARRRLAAQQARRLRTTPAHSDPGSAHDSEDPNPSREAGAWARAGAVPRTRKRRTLFREVWKNPVAWREAVTRAHGNLSQHIGRVYVLLGILLIIVFLAYDVATNAQTCVAIAVSAWTWGVLATAILATASGAGEQRARSLDLLKVTSLGPRGVIIGKLLAVGIVAAPALVTAIVLLLPGMGTLLPATNWNLDQGVWDGMMLRYVCLSAWSLSFPLALASFCLAFGLAIKQPARAWLASGALCAALVLLPPLGVEILGREPVVLTTLALLNPALRPEDLDLALTISTCFWLAAAGLGAFLAVRTVSPSR